VWQLYSDCPRPAISDQAFSLDDESLGEFAVAATMAVLTGLGLHRRPYRAVLEGDQHLSPKYGTA